MALRVAVEKSTRENLVAKGKTGGHNYHLATFRTTKKTKRPRARVGAARLSPVP